MKEVVKILMERDEMTREDAEENLEELRERFADGENPEELLYEIGLEPDYIFDLI